MHTTLFFFLVLCYLSLFIWGIFLTRKHGVLNLNHVLLLVIIGLVYDNLIIALGKYIGEGNTLIYLSYMRYWLHALFTPTLILFAWDIYSRADLTKTNATLWKAIAYLITIGFICYELFTSIKGLKLEPVWKNGVLTYEDTGHSVSLMVIFITLILGLVGLHLIIKFRFFWLLFATLTMIIGSVLTIWIKNFPIMNVMELLFIFSLLLTKQFIEKIEMHTY